MLFFARPTALALGLTSAVALSAPLLILRHNPHTSPLSLFRVRADSSPVSPSGAARDWSYRSSARTPVFEDGGGWQVNPRAVRQLSLGSVLGVLGGVVVGFFSKPLALLLGLAVFGVQYLESKGIRLVPRDAIQGYFKNIDVRSAVQDNVAFKLSFGLTFALASFAEF